MIADVATELWGARLPETQDLLSLDAVVLLLWLPLLPSERRVGCGLLA